ncbi:AfsR/SARP family transcriptional regulator [Lipingzhangella sp. LS1_29]|uniref:AfsR/SARP family transcriptional regulator n=1 Tax=Lipingzhangella rawalii TaxID=2055835 RepID=A0ABU2H2J4_9ACTN|nr:AfsR/SARP family transcriptional regulator [Lipingzhangella rawalii]MDS1269512.1 AfsR/SARP family transcriptional regulator [Lipingzhangella rawalii]
MDFRILGPVDVRGAAGPVQLGGQRNRIVLATLLLSHGTPVSATRLIDDVWAARPPDTARNQIQICVSQLRSTFRDTMQRRIRTRHPGYLLDLDGCGFDAARFCVWEREAEQAVARGDLTTAVALLARALRLWRGPALDGVDSATAQSAAARWNERHLVAWERYAELCLAAGWPELVVAGLRQLVVEYPLRERPHELFMLALYRSGAQSEALEVYRAYRDRVCDSLGLDPGQRLRRMEQAILGQCPTLTATVPVQAPWAAQQQPEVVPLGGVH